VQNTYQRTERRTFALQRRLREKPKTAALTNILCRWISLFANARPGSRARMAEDLNRMAAYDTHEGQGR
jgi:hypothetical protein